MKRKLSVLELELTRLPTNSKATNTYLETLKKSPKVSSVKKMSWKIIKIITKEGEYIPCANSEVFMIMTKKNKPTNKSKSKSK